jgi:hypothetical protein
MDKKDTKEFQRLYQQETGLKISPEQAQEKGSKVISMVKMLIQEIKQKEKNNVKK